MKTKLMLFMIAFASVSYSQNKNRALIIGISEYKELPMGLQLQYADDDAIEFYNFIRSKAIGNIDSTDIKLLLNKDATAAQIYSALDELIDVTKENDKIIIYFSGHGDIETKTIRQRGFLLAHDSPRAGYQVGGTVKLSDLQDYLETLVSINKARVVLITDACRSGKLAGGESGAAQTTAVLNEQWGSITKILSSQAGELSGESSEWGSGHGVFTYNLINGLWGLADYDKDGWVSLTELNIFLSTEVPKATFDSQHPVISGNFGSKISRVDKNKLAWLLAKSVQTDQSMMLASNKGSFVGLDTVSKRLYTNFLDAIKNGNLILPKSKNAFAYYQQLNQLNQKNAPFINDLKRVLVANLEDDVQKTLNRYMKQDTTFTHDEFSLAHDELECVLSLVPKNYLRYKNIKAKKLFLNADLTECTCSAKDVGDRKAKRSLALLKEAIALEPEMAYLHNSLGSAYFFLGKYDSAILSYKTANQLAPAWVYPVNNLGTLHYELNEFDSAMYFFKKSIAMAPEHGFAYKQAIRALWDFNKPGEALNYALEYARLDSSSSSFDILAEVNFRLREYNRAKVYHQDGDLEKAIKYYEIAISLNPYLTECYIPLGDLYLEYYGATDDAIELFQHAVTLNPNWVEGFIRLGGLYFDQLDFEKARGQYEQALRLDPKCANCYERLGSLYEQDDQIEKAIEHYEKAIQLDSGSVAEEVSNSLRELYERQKVEKEIENYEKIIQLDSTSIQSFIELSKLYETKGNYEKAIESFKKAIALGPTRTENLIKLGDLYKGKKEYDKAIENYNKAITTDPKATEVYVRLGHVYYSNKEYDKAIDQYKKAIAIDTTLSMAYYYIGLVQLEIKDYDKAIEYLLIVTKHYKGHKLSIGGSSYYLKYGSPYITLGKAYSYKGNVQLHAMSNARGYLIQGDLEEALSWLEKAAKAGYDISSDSFFYKDLNDNPQYNKLLAQYPTKK